MNNKRTICLVTNWYPTKENPYAGSFFKEQAFALAEQFHFVVVHYQEEGKLLDPVYWLRRWRKKHVCVERINAEKNTEEYTVRISVPISINLLKRIYTPLRLLLKKPDGMPKAYEKLMQNAWKTAFETALPKQLDLIYGVSAQTESSLLYKISKITGKPFVVAEHGPFPWPKTIIQRSEAEALKKANAFLAISYDKIRQVLLQDIKPQKIVYVGNMVDESRFLLSNGSGKEKTFIMVAAHSFYKNYPLFIEIFNRLTQITDVPFRVMVVGYNANKGYSQNAEELEQKLKASAFADKLELIPAVSREQIHAVYGRADAFVMTSVQEGMPVAALEAGCCGLPIFSTMCGGVEDYVDDTIGRLYRIIDSESFAQGLKAYLEGEITFDRQHIRQRIVSRYGVKAFTENMAAIFHDVIDTHNKTAD